MLPNSILADFLLEAGWFVWSVEADILPRVALMTQDPSRLHVVSVEDPRGVPVAPWAARRSGPGR